MEDCAMDAKIIMCPTPLSQTETYPIYWHSRLFIKKFYYHLQDDL